MKKFAIKILLLYTFLLFFGFSCGTIHKNTNNKERYSCKNYDFSAALVEIVDAETNGEISGDTHFHSKKNNEIFYSYQRYDSSRKALDKLGKEQKEADKLLKEKDLKDNSGKEVGKKIVFYAEKQMSAGLYKNYFLLWTKGSMFYWIRSKSLAGIKEMEKECEF